ncbi:MAG: Lrp/AsnC family transcriptional regulator [Anaerolineales bacterium]|nr:Lrp/AsnC family transcriptional regulator [Anaerolineales bacterium]
MSIRAYVLTNVEVGSGAGVVEDLLTMEVVKSAENVTGPFDVIAIIEVDDTASLGKLLITEIESIKGITDTLTCVVT